MSLDLKAGHPALNVIEITNICHAHSGRKPNRHAMQRVLTEQPIPLKMVRCFALYHEIEGSRECRRAVATLHFEG